LIYSGPIIPMIISTALRLKPKFRWALYIVLSIHLLSFVPFTIEWIKKDPDAEFWFLLIFPMITGIASLIISISILILRIGANKNIEPAG